MPQAGDHSPELERIENNLVKRLVGWVVGGGGDSDRITPRNTVNKIQSTSEWRR